MVGFLSHIVSILYVRGLRCGAVYYPLYIPLNLLFYCGNTLQAPLLPHQAKRDKQDKQDQGDNTINWNDWLNVLKNPQIVEKIRLDLFELFLIASF